jgi:PIN like domain
MEKDTAWIASVSREGLIILTRDRKIRSRPAERAVFEAAGARSFVVTTGASTPLDDLRALLAAWPRIQHRIQNQSGPFMYGISRDGRMTQFIPTEGPAGPAARRKRVLRRRSR